MSQKPLANERCSRPIPHQDSGGDNVIAPQNRGLSKNRSLASRFYTERCHDQHVSEVTETDDDGRILNVPDNVQEHAADTLWLDGAVADEKVITKYVDSAKWCGDERTKYAVLKVQATSFVLAVICVALALVLVSVMFPHEWSLIGP